MLSKRAIRAASLLIGTLVPAAAVGKGSALARTFARWRHLDATYEERFAPPAQLAPDLRGRKLVFHIKTGLDQDDSQICVGFNIVYAALQAGADVSVVFDAGAVLDLTGEESRLDETRVPLRLRKVIAAQTNVPLAQAPSTYRAYLDLLHQKGAAVYANTAMLVVTGDAATVQRQLPAFPYVGAAPYAKVAGLLAGADSVIAY